MIRDIAIAISLANLCLMKIWSYVNFTYLVDTQYHSQFIPNANNYFAAILNVFLLAAFFLAAMTLARRSKKLIVIKGAKVVFVIITTIPVYIVMSNSSKTLSIIFILVLLVLLLRMFLYFRRDVIIILTKGVLIFFTFFILNLSLPVIKIINMNSLDFENRPLAEAIKVKEQTNNRILWIIFDEMDQHLTFEDRPSTLELPEIDQFRAQV